MHDRNETKNRMTMSEKNAAKDYSSSLNLPKTDFPMRAGLPRKEPEIIAGWDEMQLYKKLREQSKGRVKFILHDGPPYANGHLHIGHALNKILKDIINRSFQMRERDANYVPGWDCHGLPIEWKIEEQYRAKGKDKDTVPVNEFRRECREFADHWIKIQAKEFRRLGVEGDFEHPYKTMDYSSEAIIAAELHKFAMSDQLYRGSKPIMWSVVERTALAEAEVEYHEVQSDTVWVKFPVQSTQSNDLNGTSIVIWTTTPWTIPGNRAISFTSKISYGLFEVIAAENDFGPQAGERLVFADKLAAESLEKAKLEFKKVRTINGSELAAISCHHPLRGYGGGYEFIVPLMDGEHVTDEAGTGFVHTAPGHGREDFDAWMDCAQELESRGISAQIPFTVDDAGYFTKDAPGFGPDRENGPARVLDDKGKKGDANQSVITALINYNMLFARGRIKHDYPHSWRSKKPVIFRNTPQWFVYMDRDIEGSGETLRSRSLNAISETRFVPDSGQKRLHMMIERRPDWVLSRQRAWGVPIAIFADIDGNILKDIAVNERIITAFNEEGADAWFAEGAKERFLNGEHDAVKWQQVKDILDVWFDSGSTHAFCLEQREDLKWPADLYLEGSDQHRGWFHSSLLESCGTRGRAPYEAVLTHGFTMAEDGRKMSKSLSNTITPEEIIKQYGADILRMWVSSVDYSEDQRMGNEAIKTSVDAYRKMRNTLRWMLGTLAHDKGDKIPVGDMPELERLMLHRLVELNQVVNSGYDAFDFKRIFSQLFNFMTVEMSAFYFDIRKDALYCDAPSSNRRKGALQVVGILFDTITKWMAPMLPFTMEECWLSRYQNADSIHMEQFNDIPEKWRDDALADKWRKIRRVRRVVTGALEIERREKRIGSSLEAAPVVYINDKQLAKTLDGQDFAEICITSQIEITTDEAPENAFRLEGIDEVAVVPVLASGAKCARSWRILAEVGSDKDYPDLSLRDADAMRELEG
jgi:isoleucyl-tRNA synthetase